MSRISENLKVVADYSSEDEERETIAQKMRTNTHRKVQEKCKKSEMKDRRDKRFSQKSIRTEESSSDDDITRRHSKRSRKHRDSVEKEDTFDDRTSQPEKYSDGNDYDQGHSKSEVQKNKYQSKNKVSDHNKRGQTRYMQKRMQSFDHNSDRKEMERNKHKLNDGNARRKQEKSRYHLDGSDNDDYHRRDKSPLEEYGNDQNNRKNYRREDRAETLSNKYQEYGSESDYQRRSKKRQTQKSQHQQDDNDANSRSDRLDTQSEDSTNCDRRDIRYVQETVYQSDSDESDHGKKDKRKQQADKSSNELEDDRSHSNRRRHRQHPQKERDWSSDSSELDKHNRRHEKKDKYQDDRSNKDRRKDKKLVQKSSRHQHDGHLDEKQQSEKNKHQQDDNIGTDYNRKALQESSHQHGSEKNHDRGQIEKRRLRKDSKERSYNKQKESRKSVQESKNHYSEGSDMDRANDSAKSRQDRCRWDSSEDERDDRRKSWKFQQSSDDEYDKQENIEKYSFTDKSNSQKNLKKNIREDNRRKKRSRREKEKSSEVQPREELARDDSTRDSGRKDKHKELELRNRTPERNENAESDKKDFNDGFKKKQNEDDILTRTGGAYIPPARLRAMQAKITDKSSINYQRLAWEALKKSINGLINKVNVSNLGIIVKEIFKENIVRAKGVLARSIMQAQAASPTFTHVYASLVAIINSRFPHIGELIIKRLIIQFRRSFRRNDKQVCLACTNFIAHLVNQQTAHEVLALEILTLLLENPTDDSVELSVGFLKECGARLSDATRRGTDAIFERLRTILHDGEVDKRVQYMIEVMFAVRKDKFKDHPTVISDLDQVPEEDQFTHLITLEDAISPEDILNVFKFDPEFEANEAKYEEIRKGLLDSSDSGEDNSGDDSNSDNEEDEDNENGTQEIIDNTETNLTSLRRTIYLTIQSSLDFEECAHKLLKLELKPGQIVELCYMILDCCAQQRTYEKFFGLLAQRFCQINKMYVEPFEEIFKTAYDTIHRFETNKLRNVARFFAHLFYTDAVSWQILSHIKLNEDETTSSSRIFVKILFQELCEYLGLLKLNERVKDPTMQEAFEGLFPRDSPRNTRFAINFFTSIGLGGLTDELREHLKNAPKTIAFPLAAALTVSVNNDDNPDLSSEEARSKAEGSPSTDLSSLEEEPRSKKSRRTKKKKEKKEEKQSKKRRKK